MNLAFWYSVLTSVIFWSTAISFLLAVVDRWCNKWFASYPKSKFSLGVQSIEDLCDQIGNCFKQKVAPKPWDGEDRRGDEAK